MLKRAKERDCDICKGGVVVGLLDQPIGVLKDVKGVGEGEERRRVGGERKELLQGNYVL